MKTLLSAGMLLLAVSTPHAQDATLDAPVQAAAQEKNTTDIGFIPQELKSWVP